VTEIGRHFAGRIIISNSDLAARRVSGTFTVTDTDAALALLRESLGLSVIRMGPLSCCGAENRPSIVTHELDVNDAIRRSHRYLKPSKLLSSSSRVPKRSLRSSLH